MGEAGEQGPGAAAAAAPGTAQDQGLGQVREGPADPADPGALAAQGQEQLGPEVRGGRWVPEGPAGRADQGDQSLAIQSEPDHYESDPGLQWQAQHKRRSRSSSHPYRTSQDQHHTPHRHFFPSQLKT